jgi:PhnB protein
VQEVGTSAIADQRFHSDVILKEEEGMAEKQDIGPTRGITPYLTVRGGGAAEAVEFYQNAFGAEERFRQLADDGKRLVHCHLVINGASVMLSDDFAENGGTPPSGVTIHLQVEDADAWWNRALAAGFCEITMPLAEQFWGDRYGQFKDPYGHHWSIGAPKR